jgi:hypothetical protein
MMMEKIGYKVLRQRNRQLVSYMADFILGKNFTRYIRQKPTLRKPNYGPFAVLKDIGELAHFLLFEDVILLDNKTVSNSLYDNNFKNCSLAIYKCIYSESNEEYMYMENGQMDKRGHFTLADTVTITRKLNKKEIEEIFADANRKNRI